MEKKWESAELHEHPARHRAGTYGRITLSAAGVYGLMQGNCWISCPQDWAAQTHHAENGGKITG